MPDDLKYILGNLSLVDVTYNPLQFRFRLHGSNVADRYGSDMTNTTVDEITDPERARTLKEHFTEVVDRRRPIVQLRYLATAYITLPNDSEALTLPLSNDDKTINMLLAALVWKKEEKK
jgi:hypothetical protein